MPQSAPPRGSALFHHILGCREVLRFQCGNLRGHVSLWQETSSRNAFQVRLHIEEASLQPPHLPSRESVCSVMMAFAVEAAVAMETVTTVCVWGHMSISDTAAFEHICVFLGILQYAPQIMLFRIWSVHVRNDFDTGNKILWAAAWKQRHSHGRRCCFGCFNNYRTLIVGDVSRFYGYFPSSQLSNGISQHHYSASQGWWGRRG